MVNMTPNCPHSRLVWIGDQETLDKPLRLYNCEACHNTVARHRYFRTEEEIEQLLLRSDLMRWYLADKALPINPENNFEALESLINEVSRARTPENWR
jgi:uncharacterized protein YlaI